MIHSNYSCPLRNQRGDNYLLVETPHQVTRIHLDTCVRRQNQTLKSVKKKKKRKERKDVVKLRYL